MYLHVHIHLYTRARPRTHARTHAESRASGAAAGGDAGHGRARVRPGCARVRKARTLLHVRVGRKGVGFRSECAGVNRACRQMV